VEFPNYRLLDATYYLLGFLAWVRWGKTRKASRPCSPWCVAATATATRSAASPGRSTGMNRGPLPDAYSGLHAHQEGLQVPGRNVTRVGEMHFDAGELAPAISAYSRVAVPSKDSPYYDKGHLQVAWSYYRDNRFPDAIREFDNLVKWADSKKAAGDQVRIGSAPRGWCSTWASASPSLTGTAIPCPTRKPDLRTEVARGFR